MKRKHICIIIAAFIASNLYSLSLNDLLAKDTIEQLVEKTNFTQIQYDTAVLRYAPRYEPLRILIDNYRRTNTSNPSITVEALYLYQKKSSGADWTSAERQKLYTAILSISTLTGLEYFSKSRNKMHILYESSAIIDSPSTKNVLPDPLYQIIPGELKVYARQKDTTFGDNLYTYNYYANDASFIVRQENNTALSYGPIKMVDKNNLHSFIALIDCTDSILIYSALLARASLPLGMKQQAGVSLTNRTEALMTWFIRKVGLVFQ